MEFTKEQAITEHRKMWNWIADMIEEKKEAQKIYNLKQKYCDTYFEYESIINTCFLCHYDHMSNDAYGNRYCSLCPLEWESNRDSLMCLDENVRGDCEGLFELCCDEDDYVKQVALARKIANLKEREMK